MKLIFLTHYFCFISLKFYNTFTTLPFCYDCFVLNINVVSVLNALLSITKWTGEKKKKRSVRVSLKYLLQSVFVLVSADN